MKKYFQSVFTILLAAAGIFGQDAAPKPTPTPLADTDVVKISTNLIQIDVTVTDAKGKIITDLRRDEIEIYENGQKQNVSNFSFVSNQRETQHATVEKSKDKTPTTPPPPPTAVKPEHVRRTIALVVDDLTLSFESTYYVRRALKKFVDEQMQDGDLVAIIRTGAGIGALQQFTTDKRQLYAAIEKVRWNPAGSGKIGAFAPLEGKLDAGSPPPGGRTPEEAAREFNEFRENVFATGTLGAVNYVVRGMQEFPGRKSILLLSEGFRLFEKDPGGEFSTGRVLESLRRLIDQANRASVVVYTMDARGLQTTGLTAADDTTGRTAENIRQLERDRIDQLQDTQDGLRYLARETGGIAIINNNDLSRGIRSILDDQSYYLVAYEPDAETFDPKIRRFNQLVVKVKRPGAQVRYRSGFFGVSNENVARSPETGNRRLLNALTSPFAVNDIPLRLNALFGNDQKRGSYVRSLLHVTTKDLIFTDQPDGNKLAVFDILAVGFDDNGIPVEQISKTYRLSVKKDAYERFLKVGFVYDFTFPIKKAGAYQLRVAIRDHGSEKVGSANQFIDVPNLKKGRLTLSGVVLENITTKEWQRRSGQKTPPDGGFESDPLADTSLRQFKQGTVLNYGVGIYNAILDASRRPNLSWQTRIFRDGKLIFEGMPKAFSPVGLTDLKALNLTSSISLGTANEPGDYVLEIVITDNLAKEKQKTATQFVQFEVVE